MTTENLFDSSMTEAKKRAGDSRRLLDEAADVLMECSGKALPQGGHLETVIYPYGVCLARVRPPGRRHRLLWVTSAPDHLLVELDDDRFERCNNVVHFRNVVRASLVEMLEYQLRNQSIAEAESYQRTGEETI